MAAMGKPQGFVGCWEKAPVGAESFRRVTPARARDAERSGSTVEDTVCCEAGSGEIKRRGKTDAVPQRIIRLRRSWHVLTDVIGR